MSCLLRGFAHPRLRSLDKPLIAALGYFLYKVAKDLLKAVQSVLGAIVGLISALIAMLPQIVYAGLIAFGGAWIITNMNPVWIPIALR